jgi:hypothetical protein
MPDLTCLIWISSRHLCTNIGGNTMTDEQFIDDNTNNNSTIESGSASSKFGATGHNNKKSHIGAITSSIQQIAQTNTNNIKYKYDYNLHVQEEIDTRADTLCAGLTFILYEATGKVVNITGFHDSFNTI